MYRRGEKSDIKSWLFINTECDACEAREWSLTLQFAADTYNGNVFIHVFFDRLDHQEVIF